MSNARPSDSLLPRPGDVVAGKYLIETVIGQGGMGVVLGARDQSLGRRVAIKFLVPNKASRDGAAARFEREARAAASIQSEHVVRVHEIGALPNGAATSSWSTSRGRTWRTCSRRVAPCRHTTPSTTCCRPVKPSARRTCSLPARHGRCVPSEARGSRAR